LARGDDDRCALIAVAGKTEAIVLTRLLDGRLKPRRRSAILLDPEGVDNDASAAAAYLS
jgi:hypothetical protein